MSEDEKACRDIKNTFRKMQAEGFKPSIRTFDEADAYDETVPVDGDGTMIAFTIGMRGALASREARIAAKAWRKMAAKYPKSIIVLQIAGYDDDPREVWQIEEARDYYKRWARFAGLTSSTAAQATPLHDVSFGVLAICGAFSDIDPNSVRVPRAN
jgi:hypothetical protein